MDEKNNNLGSMLLLGGAGLAALATGLAGFPILGALAVGVLALVGGALIAAFANGNGLEGMFSNLTNAFTGGVKDVANSNGVGTAQDPYGLDNSTLLSEGVLGLTGAGLLGNKIRKDWTPNKLINESKAIIAKHKLGEKLDDDEIAKLQKTLNRADKQINSGNWKTLWIFKKHPGLEEEIDKTIKQANRILEADAREAARVKTQAANVETIEKPISNPAEPDVGKPNTASSVNNRAQGGLNGSSEIIVDKSVPAVGAPETVAKVVADANDHPVLNQGTPAAKLADTNKAPNTNVSEVESPSKHTSSNVADANSNVAIDKNPQPTEPKNRITGVYDTPVPTNRLPSTPATDPLAILNGQNGDGATLTPHNKKQVVDAHVKSTPPLLDAPIPHSINPHVLTASGLGAGLGTVGFVQGYQQGDIGQMLISGADVTVSVANPILQSSAPTAAFNTGTKELAKTGTKEVLKSAAKEVVKRAAIPIIIADGGYQIYKEEGLEHKAERGVATGATIAAASGASTLLTSGLVAGGLSAAGLASGAALTGAAAVAAPVTVAVAAAVGTALVADTAIQTRRIYEQEDQRFRAREDHGHIIGAQQLVAKRLKDKGMILDSSNTLDLTNPYNVSVLREVLEDERKAMKEKANANNGYIFNPRWSHLNPFKRVVESRDAQERRTDRYNGALRELQILDAAIAELPNYVKDLKEHKAKQERLLALATSEEQEVKNAYQRVNRHNTKNLLDKNGDGVISVMDYAREDGGFDKNNLAEMQKDIAALAVLEKHNKDMLPVKAGLEKMVGFIESEFKKIEMQNSVSFNPISGISGGEETSAPLSSPLVGGVSSSGQQLV
jgi:hypothetical protein